MGLDSKAVNCPQKWGNFTPTLNRSYGNVESSLPEYRGLSSNGTGMYAKGCRPGADTPPQVQRSGPVARAVPRL